MIITIIMSFGVAITEMEFSFYSLAPKESIRFKQLKSIIENFPTASSIIVVVESRNREDKIQSEKKVKAAVDAIQKELSNPEYSKYITRIEGKMDMSFFENHGLMLLDIDNIKRMSNLFSNPNIVPFLKQLNDNFEDEYSADEENLSEDERMLLGQFNGIKEILYLMKESSDGIDIKGEELSASLDRFLIGSPYIFNKDNTMALIIIQPTFTMNDIIPLMNGVPLIDKTVREIADKYDVKAGLTGMTVVAKDEGETGEKGIVASMLISLLLIIILLIITYKMYSVPLISGIPLMLGVFWTVGMAGFFLKRINLVTAAYLVVLIGLGVDYAIHLLTAFTLERDDGKGFFESIGNSFRKSGSGIVLGALTTASAFFALVITRSSMVKELGIVAGMGIICELIAMFILVPALLGLRNERILKRGKTKTKLFNKIQIKFTFMEKLGKSIKAKPYIYAITMFLLALLILPQARNVSVETNIMNMEAKGLESIALQDKMTEEFEMSPDVIFYSSNDLNKIRDIGKRLRKLESIKEIESIALFLPADSEQKERKPYIEDFKSYLSNIRSGNYVNIIQLREELSRLEDNLCEMSDLAYISGMDNLHEKLDNLTGKDKDGNKVKESIVDELLESLSGKDSEIEYRLVKFQKSFVLLSKIKLIKMANTDKVTLDLIPAYIRDSYVSRDSSCFLLNIIPKENPWVKENRDILYKQVTSITDETTSMINLSDILVEIAERSGLIASLAAIIAIFLLLLIDFRNFKLSIITMIPLLLSFGTLFGFMAIAGIKFDFVNIISIPLLIGIGVDDAVHINHRYLIEGKGNMDIVIAKTGKAVLLTSITTIIAFASFIPSLMTAMHSTGIVLSAAMAVAFFFSILFHPAILIIVYEKWGLSITPWRFKNEEKEHKR